VGKPFPTSSFPTSQNSTDLTTLPDPSSVSNLKLANSHGSIEWTNVDTQYQDSDTYIKIGTGFVSVDAANLAPSLNGSGTVKLNVDGCTTWKVYYADHPVTSLNDLKTENRVIADQTTGCTEICTSATCSGNVLTIQVPHFDGYGGEGGGGSTSVPEFGTWALLLALTVTILGVFFRRKS
jgi:hypothetical protein